MLIADVVAARTPRRKRSRSTWGRIEAGWHETADEEWIATREADGWTLSSSSYGPTFLGLATLKAAGELGGDLTRPEWEPYFDGMGAGLTARRERDAACGPTPSAYLCAKSSFETGYGAGLGGNRYAGYLDGWHAAAATAKDPR